ncbi:MAG: MBL fold metallo-hydrolase [Desulfobacteraceae bacterium]|nr:MAG: MBL fold metallo-hydrolase [Desulfobacteraceae bacterium]
MERRVVDAGGAILRVRFWGTRGSLPRSLTGREVRKKISRILELSQSYPLGDAAYRNAFIDTVLPFALRGSWGGSTSCVQIEHSDEYILLDAGTGLRDFGNQLMKEKKGAPAVFHIFISHLHWDHIQGFPFFVPAYLPENTINIYGCHPELEEAFMRQQESPFFPVPLKSLGATIRFIRLPIGESFNAAGFVVDTLLQNHPGKSYGYSFAGFGRKIVYSTDSEHLAGVDHSSFIHFFRNADLLIFDAQYSLAEAELVKRDWGHSSNVIGVELAVLSETRHLALFHTEPNLDDEDLEQIEEETLEYSRIFARDYPLKVTVAYDRLEVEL